MFKFSTVPLELHNAWREEKTKWSFKNIHTKFWTKQAINSLCTHRISTKSHSHTHMHQKWWKHNICRIWRCKRFSYRRKPLEVCFELFTWGLHFAPGRSQYIQFLSFQSLPLGTLIVSQQQDVCAPEMDQNRLLCEDNNTDISWLLRDFSGKHAYKHRNSALFLWGAYRTKDNTIE